MRNLTAPNPELEKYERDTVPGMAFWAGTGPVGKTCGQCGNYGYYYEDSKRNSKHRDGCALFYKHTRKHAGTKLPESTPSCKYFK